MWNLDLAVSDFALMIVGGDVAVVARLLLTGLPVLGAAQQAAAPDVAPSLASLGRVRRG